MQKILSGFSLSCLLCLAALSLTACIEDADADGADESAEASTSSGSGDAEQVSRGDQDPEVGEDSAEEPSNGGQTDEPADDDELGAEELAEDDCEGEACEQAGDPSCEGVDCAEGLSCALVDVVCVQEPCPAIPMCLAGESGPGGCELVLCEEGSYCDDISGEAECLPLPSCEGVDCDAGEECQLADVSCLREPCPAQPQCVATGAGPSDCALVFCEEGSYCDDISGEAECLPLPSCDDLQCNRSERCELVDVTCFRAPCPPQPRCVDLGIAGGEECGDSICGAGQVCCNSSCGTCTAPGGFCTQQFCPPSN